MRKKSKMKTYSSADLEKNNHFQLLKVVIYNIIALHFRSGDYLVKDVELGTIYSQDTLEKEKISRLQTQFIVGKNRSQQQDAEHSIHQMVEIADRALSSG